MVWLVKLNRRRRNWLNTGSINQTETLKCQRTWNIFILNSQTYTLPRPQGSLGCCCCFLLFHSFSPGWCQTMLPTSVLAYSALLTCHPSAVIPHLPIITGYYPQWSLLPCWIVVLTCVSVDPAWLVSSLCFLVLLPNLFFLCRLPYPYLLLLPCGPWVGVSELSWIGFGGFVTHGLCEEECEGFPALDIVPLDSLEPPSPVAVYISPGVHL